MPLSVFVGLEGSLVLLFGADVRCVVIAPRTSFVGGSLPPSAGARSNWGKHGCVESMIDRSGAEKRERR
jgi:hypothetical protein